MSSVMSLGMNFAAQALQVHSVGMQVAAHNIANISTDEFRPQVATYATGSRGNGVELESVRQPDLAMGSQKAGLVNPLTGKQASGTDLAGEMVHMIATQHGFDANAAVIRTADEMTGTLLNIKA